MPRFGFRTTAAIATILTFALPNFSGHGSHAQSSPGPYALSDLGTLGGSTAQAQDINEAGQIVGYATNSANRGRGYVWQNGVMTDLGALADGSALAIAINESAQAVGWSSVGQFQHAVLWQNGSVTDLEPGSAGNGVAEGINDSGHVVGTRNYWQGFVWQNGTATNLPHLGGGVAIPKDINNAGQAVGASYTTEQNELGPLAHAVLWEGGVAIDVGILPGDEDSNAQAINENGVIVGATGRTEPETYQNFYRPFIYDNGVMTAIPAPSEEAYAVDVNDDGVVVGTMRTGFGVAGFSAWIYANGVVTDLNSLIPSGSGLHLVAANGINNAGQIVGNAYDAQARYHAFLLTPVAAGTPVLSVSDASATEGNIGTTAANVTVTLSRAATQQVRVDFATADGTAAGGTDYTAAAGTVVFDAGETSKTIQVIVNGDRSAEPNETVVVRLSNVSAGALIGDGTALLTIADDEPRITIGNVTAREGNSGATPFAFLVTLSAAYDAPVSVNFATVPASAIAPDDFAERSGTLTFSAGQTQQSIVVSVKGDRKSEPQEVFYVNLSDASGAIIATFRGTGVIQNDDR